MGEQCKGCPWLDEQKKQCRRRAPKFCLLDRTDSAKSVRDVLRSAEADSETRPHQAA